MRTGQQSRRYRAASVTPEAKALIAQLSEGMDEDFLPVGIVGMGDNGSTSFLYTSLVSKDLMVAMLEAAAKKIGASNRVLQ